MVRLAWKNGCKEDGDDDGGEMKLIYLIYGNDLMARQGLPVFGLPLRSDDGFDDAIVVYCSDVRTVGEEDEAIFIYRNS